MLAGMVTLFGSLFLFLYGTRIGMFAAARILQGFAEACICTLGMTIISDTFPDDELGRQTSIVMIFHLAGLATGGAAGGSLFVHFGYKAPFIFCLAFAGVDFLLRLGLIERRNNPKNWFETESEIDTEQQADASQDENEIPIRESVVSTHEKDESNCNYKRTIDGPDVEVTEEIYSGGGLDDEISSATVTMLQLLRNPRVLTVLLVSFAHGFCITVFEPTMPVHLANEWGLDASKIGLIYFAQVFPSFIASPIAGYIYDCTGAKMISFLTIVCCAAVIALMGIPNTNTAGGVAPLVVLAGMNEFFAGAFYAVTLPETSFAAKALANGSDSAVARCYGLHNIAYALGHFVGPLLGGYVFDKIGFFWMCIIVACFVLSSAPFALIFLGSEVTRTSKACKKLCCI
ncbi:major facilitator superfamily domain-containing protein [Fennellomyces sp. T-0311]|nr:major facilitator superfamily domain-containing protein [Fennellomyces sp. T-0311]